MKVSVIVPTYNGAHKLPNILKALEEQTFHDFETLVVVDGSTDHTIELLEKSKFKLQQLKVIFQNNRGRAAVRNKGAAEASGDLLIFFDDDMRPMPDCVYEHIKHHENKLRSILVGSAIEDENLMKTDIQKYRLYLSLKWTGNTHKRKLKTPYITGQNFSLSKNSFIELKGFDERLKDAEDYDLAIKAIKKNISIYIDPNIKAYHDDFITCSSYIKRQREYRNAQQELRRLKPDIIILFERELKPKTGIKKLIIDLFASRNLVTAIDRENFLLKILPKFLRYKIYDIIILSLGHYRHDISL